MVNFIALAKTVLSLLPVIIQAVQAVEAALPAQGQGAAKLELVKSTLQAAFATATDAVGTFEGLWSTLQPVVSSVVAFMNSTGIFKKSA
jgi:hypothetical protein